MLIGTFIATVAGLCLVVSQIHPDKITVPKQYEDGLEAELGGPRAVRVSGVKAENAGHADWYRRRRLASRLRGDIERGRKIVVYIGIEWESQMRRLTNLLTAHPVASHGLTAWNVQSI